MSVTLTYAVMGVSTKPLRGLTAAGVMRCVADELVVQEEWQRRFPDQAPPPRQIVIEGEKR